MAKNPDVAVQFPALDRLLEAREQAAKKAVSTRKHNAKEKAAKAAASGLGAVATTSPTPPATNGGARLLLHSAALPAKDGPMDTDTLDDLLLETSRTFALTIPLLPEPTRRAVCLSYLLFRVSDTFEDASSWTRDARFDALVAWCGVLRAPATWAGEARTLSASWLAKKPSEHEGYLRLVEAIPEVLGEVARLEPPRRAIVVDHAIKSAEGMADVLRRAEPDGWVRLASLQDLRDYCYIVAGIVGELLTSLFLHDAPKLASEAATLREHERAFGEALQLVNILKDENDDASEGRRFLPVSVLRSEVVALAREDLAHAATYTAALVRGGAPPGFVAFTAMPAELAEKSLDRVEKDGPGAKVSRAVVLEMMVRYKAMAAGLR